MVRIVTGCNSVYYPKVGIWLDSLERNSNIPFVFVQVGWDQDIGRNIEAVFLDRAANRGAPAETECIQHGSFMGVIPGLDEDVFIYCDGDMVMQRSLSDRELAWLDGFGPSKVSAGWNYPGESLLDELRFLGLTVDLGELQGRFPGKLERWSMLNVGVLAMQRSVWESVYNFYMERWDLACDSFTHPARQQWLICYAIHRLELDLELMPYSFHVHGHFGIHPGMDVDAALFRHALYG